MFVFVVYIGLISLIIYSMGGHFERRYCNKIKLRLIEVINVLETLDLVHINIPFRL